MQSMDLITTRSWVQIPPPHFRFAADAMSGKSLLGLALEAACIAITDDCKPDIALVTQSGRGATLKSWKLGVQVSPRAVPTISLTGNRRLHIVSAVTCMGCPEYNFPCGRNQGHPVSGNYACVPKWIKGLLCKRSVLGSIPSVGLTAGLGATVVTGTSSGVSGFGQSRLHISP